MNYDFLHDAEFDVTFDTTIGDYTTFQLGGPCPCLVTCRTPEELEQAVKRLAEEPEASFVLMGGGSNLLVSDAGYDGLVLRYTSDDPMIRVEDSDVVVSGSTDLDALVLFTVEHELDGLIKCSGIPGSVGGAIVGNAGAYGEQIGDCILNVTIMDRKGHTMNVAREDLDFGYRSSRLQRSDDIVVEARIRLEPGKRASMESRRADIRRNRNNKHPDWRRDPCVGSYFRNVDPTSSAERRQAAGWFLEKAGVKELKVGGARVYKKHANIIVKTRDCSAQHVHDLAQQMAQAVQEKFDLDLVREVRLLGSFDGEQDAVPTGFY